MTNILVPPETVQRDGDGDRHRVYKPTAEYLGALAYYEGMGWVHAAQAGHLATGRMVALLSDIPAGYNDLPTAYAPRREHEA